MAIIGIDLGTSNSAAAALRGGRPIIIPSSERITLGGKAFPSYVAFAAHGQMLVGEPARRQAALNPDGTATAFKRPMGRREKVRLRGKGLPRFGGGGRGDLYVRLEMRVPERLSERQRHLFEQLRAAGGRRTGGAS